MKKENSSELGRSVLFLWVYLFAKCLRLNNLWLHQTKNTIMSMKLLSLCFSLTAITWRKVTCREIALQWEGHTGLTRVISPGLLYLDISWNAIIHIVQSDKSDSAISNRESTKIYFPSKLFWYLAAPSMRISNSFSLKFHKITPACTISFDNLLLIINSLLAGLCQHCMFSTWSRMSCQKPVT